MVRDDADGLHRVDLPSDWLQASAPSCAANTLKSKAESAAQWWAWCAAQGIDPERTDALTFARFVTALVETPKGCDLAGPVRALPGDERLRAGGTIGVRVTHLKSMYKWACDNGRVPLRTGQAIGGFKTPRRATRRTADRLYADEVTTLLTAPLHPRDRFCIELLYGAGLREGEAIGLHVADLCVNKEVARALECPLREFVGPHLHVRRRLNPNGAIAKSPDERVVPLAPRVMDAYRGWQAWCFEHLPEAVDCPFAILTIARASRGRPLSLSGFNSMWALHVKTLPGLARATPHLLRHTFASELIDAGVDAHHVQILLGHRHPASTQIYTHTLAATLTMAVTRLGEWRWDRMGVVA